MGQMIILEMNGWINGPSNIYKAKYVENDNQYDEYI